MLGVAILLFKKLCPDDRLSRSLILFHIYFRYVRHHLNVPGWNSSFCIFIRKLTVICRKQFLKFFFSGIDEFQAVQGTQTDPRVLTFLLYMTFNAQGLPAPIVGSVSRWHQATVTSASLKSKSKLFCNQTFGRLPKRAWFEIEVCSIKRSSFLFVSSSASCCCRRIR